MTKQTLTILPPKAVCTKISASRSALYNKLNPKHPGYDASFPVPLKLGDRGRRVGFLEHEIDMWIEGRKNARDEQSGKSAVGAL